MYTTNMFPSRTARNLAAATIAGAGGSVVGVVVAKGHIVVGLGMATALLAGIGCGVVSRIAHTACVLASVRKV